ncbi:hypothetical protein [Thermomonospora umbrina]|uniref:Uncharacterized protein n=1 Tax=Thermomonospora umbrina TaxID=111806 RepID=A0A3D9SQU8_9ACTN|nr:hypothetical protein [Thermomonospora umbrina]REE96343.1 hypothetical protein DFJ69_1773 [Thermomonospora umbrina]
MGFEVRRYASGERRPKEADRSLPDPRHDLRLRCRIRLLALAADLDDLGVRPRLPDTIMPPYALRCWDPARQGPTFEVECARDRHGRLVFRALSTGEFLGDAENAIEPGDTGDLAQEIARRVLGGHRTPPGA